MLTLSLIHISGIEVCELETADKMAKRMVDIVLPDYPFKTGDEVVVLVSGLGATPVMELYVLYNEIEKIMVDVYKRQENNKCYVLCNYKEKKEREFRKTIRVIISKLSAKRCEMWKMTFSAALGKKVKTPVELWDSFEDAQEGLKEAVLEAVSYTHLRW